MQQGLLNFRFLENLSDFKPIVNGKKMFYLFLFWVKWTIRMIYGLLFFFSPIRQMDMEHGFYFLFLICVTFYFYAWKFVVRT